MRWRVCVATLALTVRVWGQAAEGAQELQSIGASRGWSIGIFDLVSFGIGVLASYLVWWVTTIPARWALWNRAKKLVGEWDAFDYDTEHLLKPMAGAGKTTITQEHGRLSSQSHVLKVKACDLNPERRHDGYIVLSKEWENEARRYIEYEQKGEIARYEVIIPNKGDALYLRPIDGGGGYQAHVLHRSGVCTIASAH